MKVRDIMSQPAYCIAASSSAEQAAEMMASYDVGALPVLDEEGRVVGILTDRDIVVRGLAEGLSAPTVLVKQIMTAVPTTIDPEETVSDAAFVLLHVRAHRLPVVQNEAVIGVLSADDIVHNSDEEVVRLMVREIASRSQRVIDPAGRYLSSRL